MLRLMRRHFPEAAEGCTVKTSNESREAALTKPFRHTMKAFSVRSRHATGCAKPFEKNTGLSGGGALERRVYGTPFRADLEE
jgi:hypothetical protein